MPGIDSQVISMLHMDGPDGSTIFTDERGKTWTAAGNAQIDTAQSKFGGASGLFDGTGDYIDTPDHADFDVGAGDFTIDCWLKRATDGVDHYMYGQNDSGGGATNTSLQFKILSINKLQGIFCSGGSTLTALSTGSILTTNGWVHVAMVRYGNTVTLYINGTADGTLDVTGLTCNNSAYKAAIGRPGEYTTLNFNGWIDEFRFSKGIARWTANFTPPTEAYGLVGGNQVILIAFKKWQGFLRDLKMGLIPPDQLRRRYGMAI